MIITVIYLLVKNPTRREVNSIKEQEWLQIGFDKGIIGHENLISFDKKKNMMLNLENTNATTIDRNTILRRDGRYMCYAHLSTGRKAVYGKDPNEAIRKAKKHEMGNAPISIKEKYLFKTYYQKWFITKMNSSIKPQSLDHIETSYNKYYLKSFAELDIRFIDEIIIINFVIKQIENDEKGYITRKEYSKIMQIVKETLGSYYDECVLAKIRIPSAIAWDTVKRKIEEQVIIKSPKKKEIALSEDERKKMEKKALAEKNIAFLLWILVNYTGIRLGEVSALLWSDINFDEEVIDIAKTTCSYYSRDKHGKRIEYIRDIGNTKTEHSKREIPLTLGAIAILKQIELIQKENNWYHSTQLISYYGKEQKAKSTAISKELKKFAESVGIDKNRIHPHLLRKTVATVLHDAGMSTRDIADVLGHSDISTTEQCYIISTAVDKKRKKMATAL